MNKKVPKITEEQGIILTGYLGILCTTLETFLEDVEERTGEIYGKTQAATNEFWEMTKALYRDDFMAILPIELKTEDDEDEEEYEEWEVEIEEDDGH